MNYSKLKVGDKVLIGGDSGFCTDGEDTITRIYQKYDETTGEPYNVICCDEAEYSGRYGGRMDSAKAYYIKRKLA